MADPVHTTFLVLTTFNGKVHQSVQHFATKMEAPLGREVLKLRLKPEEIGLSLHELEERYKPLIHEAIERYAGELQCKDT